ncbi:LPXTG cell wall anchor domain-containing protein [Blautia wexlerae]|nr:LPXTG cell wall anchor domain-containing protein [Blautia wexlerae]
MRKKRILAVLMAVLMIVTLLPSMAFAAEAGELGGKLKVKGLPAVGTVLSADYSKVTPEGVTDDDVIFSWSRQTGEKELTQVGTEKTYTVTQDDLGYVLVLDITPAEKSGFTGKLQAKTLEVTATQEEAQLEGSEEDAESEDVRQTEEDDTQNPEQTEEMQIYTQSELQPDGTEKTTDKTTDKTEDVQETEAPEDAENTDDVENAQQELSYEAVASVEGQENPVCDFGTIRAESGDNESQTMFVDIKNTGTGALNFKAISPEHFMVADIEGPLAAGESVSVWIQPRKELEEGTYDDTITYETEEGAEVSFEVKAVVEAEEEPVLEPDDSEAPDDSENPETPDNTEEPSAELGKLSISTDPAVLSFADLTEGYTQISESQTVTVTNTGDETVTLKLPESEHFDIAPVDTQAVYTLEKGASCSFLVQPKAGLVQGDYSDTLVFGIEEDESAVAQAEAGVSVKAEEKPQVSLKADPSEIIYDPMEEGYNTPEYVYRITVTNTGNAAVDLTQPQAQYFEIGELSATQLDPGAEATFTAVPKTGMTAGEYSESVQVTATNTDSQISAVAEINASFSVTKPACRITGIQNPSHVKGVKNGVEKSAKALGLPSKVVINTTEGEMKAKVKWNVKECTYDPSVKQEQTFKVNGTVVLPDGVENPDQISLITAVKVTVKAGRTAQIADPANNKITGISADGYTTQSKITFTAVGAGMDNESPGKGDVRYVPDHWTVINTNSWSQAPYTATFGITKEGTYNLTVVFNAQQYDGKSWKNTGKQDTKQVSFTISQPKVVITATPTPVQQNPAANQKKAVQTGDTTNIMPFVLILAIAAGAIVGVVVYKKKKK